MKAIARRLVSLQFAFLSLLTASDAVALDIDFKNGTWSHPNGVSVAGWDSSQTTGVTTLPDGSAATVTVTFAGAAQPTVDNLKNIDESFYVGFAFQQQSSGAGNSSSLNNYMRVDFQFSTEVFFDNLVINDIDVLEVIQVEGWSDTPGTPSGGIPANYSPGNKLQLCTLDGIAGVTPKPSYPGNTTLDPESSVGIGFDSGIRALSIYYSKQVNSESSIITTGIEGNVVALQTGSSDPRLYYTYSFSNAEPEPVEVDFFDRLPIGLTWDTAYVPSVTGGVQVSVSYSSDAKEATVSAFSIPPGGCAMTLRTKGAHQRGIVDNDATITPSDTRVNPITADASLDLGSGPRSLPQIIDAFKDSGLGNFTWFVLGDGATVMASNYTITGKVGVGPGATLEFSGVDPIPASQIVADPGATLIGGSAGAAEDLSALKASALDLSADALALPSTQTFGLINSPATITGGAPDGLNVIAVDSIRLSSPEDILTISGGPDEYFVINVRGDIDMSGSAILGLAGGIMPSHVLINASAGAALSFTGQSLEVGPTVLAPNSPVTLAGLTVMSGSLISGGLRQGSIYGSQIVGNATLAGGTGFGGEPPTIVLAEDFEGASPGIWSNGFGFWGSNQNFSNSNHGQIADGGGRYAALYSEPTQASVDLPGLLTDSQQAAVAGGTGVWGFSAWLASWTNNASISNLSVEWFDGLAGTGTSLGAAVLADGSSATGVAAVVNGNILENDATNWNVDNWSHYVTSGAVPAGAQSFVMTYSVNPGGDGYADNLSFSISE